MRIAVLLTSLGIGGAERQAIAVAERLALRGHHVRLYSLLNEQLEQWPTSLPVTYLQLKPGLLSIPAAWSRGARALRSFQPDVIHGHCFHGNMFARLVGLASPRALVVSTVHNVYEGGRGRMLMYRLTDRLSHRTAFVCEAGATRYSDLRAVSRRRVNFAPNGIDLNNFQPHPERRARFRNSLGRADEFLWVAVGRLSPAKDYPNLLRAFSLLHREEPSSRLWIVGQGTDNSLSQLQCLSQQLGVANSVQWLGLRRDTAGFLDAADGFVLASAWEGMPLVLAEAMAMGKPCVATDVGGVRQLAGDCALVVPAANPEELAEAMLQTMREVVQGTELRSQDARGRIEQNFTLERATTGWESLYAQGKSRPDRLPAGSPQPDTRSNGVPGEGGCGPGAEERSVVVD